MKDKYNKLINAISKDKENGEFYLKAWKAA